MKQSLNIYGCGNMINAIFQGLGAQELEQVEVATYTPSFTKAKLLAEAIGAQAFKDLDEMPESNIHFLGFKPQQLNDFVQQTDAQRFYGRTIVSVLAGTPIEKLKSAFPTAKNYIRVMPNTPCLVYSGVSTIYYPTETDEQVANTVIEWMASVGEVFVLETEDQLDLTTPFSGSGPAYIFEISRIMQKMLIDAGISYMTSKKLVNATLQGSAQLLIQSDESAQELRNKVTSKKGITYEALESFKRDDLEGVFKRAIDCALKRGQELSQGID